MVIFVYVSAQHVPQLGEFHPAIAAAPPMCGKPGREPKVVKPRVMSPLAPSEQATVESDAALLSYAVS